jgi:hypothetical protein
MYKGVGLFPKNEGNPTSRSAHVIRHGICDVISSYCTKSSSHFGLLTNCTSTDSLILWIFLSVSITCREDSELSRIRW